MIRRYTRNDYLEVAELIREAELLVPSPRELESFGLVWCEEEKIVGFVWGLTGENCATVFIDYFIVKKEFRELEDDYGRGKIAVGLIMALLAEMAAQKKTRVIGQLPDDPLSRGLARIYANVGMRFRNPYQFVDGDIEEILIKMKAGLHGKHSKTGN